MREWSNIIRKRRKIRVIDERTDRTNRNDDEQKCVNVNDIFHIFIRQRLFFFSKAISMDHVAESDPLRPYMIYGPIHLVRYQSLF